MRALVVPSLLMMLSPLLLLTGLAHWSPTPLTTGAHMQSMSGKGQGLWVREGLYGPGCAVRGCAAVPAVPPYSFRQVAVPGLPSRRVIDCAGRRRSPPDSRSADLPTTIRHTSFITSVSAMKQQLRGSSVLCPAARVLGEGVALPHVAVRVSTHRRQELIVQAIGPNAWHVVCAACPEVPGSELKSQMFHQVIRLVTNRNLVRHASTSCSEDREAGINAPQRLQRRPLERFRRKKRVGGRFALSLGSTVG